MTLPHIIRCREEYILTGPDLLSGNSICSHLSAVCTSADCTGVAAPHPSKVSKKHISYKSCDEESLSVRLLPLGFSEEEVTTIANACSLGRTCRRESESNFLQQGLILKFRATEEYALDILIPG